MIHGVLAEQIAAQRTTSRSPTPSGTSPARAPTWPPCSTCPPRRPSPTTWPTSSSWRRRSGPRPTSTRCAEQPVTLNPRFGVLDPEREADHLGGAVRVARQARPPPADPEPLTAGVRRRAAARGGAPGRGDEPAAPDCPWDAQQTHRSLVQYLIEETAETVEAIETGDTDHLREELGDLLLQVVFHAEIAAESIRGFGLEDVARGIADKLVARHPYVFAAGRGAERPALHLGAAQGRREGPDLGAAEASPSSCPRWPGPTRSSAGPARAGSRSTCPTSR